MTAWRILHSHGLKKWKPTWKPGLTQAMRDARPQPAKDDENWSLEDWKNVILV